MDPGTRQFVLVPVDGLLADVVTPYTAIATTLLQKIVEIDPLLDPPHTLARLGEAAGLTPNQSVRVIKSIVAIRDFWIRLDPLPELEAYREHRDVIFYAPRPQTIGLSTLMQTIDWFEWHGFKNPLVLCEEDEIGDPAVQGQDGEITIPSLSGSYHHASRRRAVRGWRRERPM